MSAENKEQTKQISSGSLSSVLSEMQQIVTEFTDEMPDYIDQVLKENLPPSTQTYDQEDRVSLLAPVDKELDHEVQHVPTKFEQGGAQVADPPTNVNRDAGSQTNRDTSFPKTSRDIVSPKLIWT